MIQTFNVTLAAWNPWFDSLPLVIPLVAAGLISLFHGKEAKAWCIRTKWWIVSTTALWAVTWLSVRATAGLEGRETTDPWIWIARSIVRGFYALGNVLFTAGFLAFLMIMLLLGPKLQVVLSRLIERLQSLEVGGVKLNLGEASATSAGLQTCWWSDKPAKEGPSQDMAGSDGPILEKPSFPSDAYTRCMKEAKPLLQQLDRNNQDDVGEQLEQLEWGWPGEYAEQLEQTATLLREQTRSGSVPVLTNKYLATALSIRPIMLYLFGQKHQGAEYLTDAKLIEPEHLKGTLYRAMGYWMIIHLCENGQYKLAEQLAGHNVLKCDSLSMTRTAFSAYILFKRSEHQQAAAQATTALAGHHPVKPYDFLAQTVLRYVAARSYLHMGRYLDVIPLAEQVMADQADKAPGLRQYLRLHAMRTLVHAATRLGWSSRVIALYQMSEEARNDTFVLNALAVITAAAGEKQTARELLERAIRLLPSAEDPMLSETLKSNLAQLGKH